MTLIVVIEWVMKNFEWPKISCISKWRPLKIMFPNSCFYPSKWLRVQTITFARKIPLRLQANWMGKIGYQDCKLSYCMRNIQGVLAVCYSLETILDSVKKSYCIQIRSIEVRWLKSLAQIFKEYAEYLVHFCFFLFTRFFWIN